MRRKEFRRPGEHGIVPKWESGPHKERAEVHRQHRLLNHERIGHTAYSAKNCFRFLLQTRVASKPSCGLCKLYRVSRFTERSITTEHRNIPDCPSAGLVGFAANRATRSTTVRISDDTRTFDGKSERIQRKKYAHITVGRDINSSVSPRARPQRYS